MRFRARKQEIRTFSHGLWCSSGGRPEILFFSMRLITKILVTTFLKTSINWGLCAQDKERKTFKSCTSHATPDLDHTQYTASGRPQCTSACGLSGLVITARLPFLGTKAVQFTVALFLLGQGATSCRCDPLLFPGVSLYTDLVVVSFIWFDSNFPSESKPRVNILIGRKYLFRKQIQTQSINTCI